MTEGLHNPTDLATLCQGFEMTKGSGCLRLLQDGEIKYQLYIKRGKLIDFEQVGKSSVELLVSGFADHDFLKDADIPELNGYQDLWNWIAPLLPSTFRFHKERYRDIIRQCIIQQLSEISFADPYDTEMIPNLPPREEEYLPSISLARFDTEFDDRSNINAFPDETVFVLLDELPTDLSFEALLVYQLLKPDNQSIQSVLQKSFFINDKTIDALRELLRSKAIKKELARTAQVDLELGEALNREAEKIDVEAIMADQQYELKEKAGEEAEDKPASIFQAATAQVKQITDEYLLNCLGNLLLFLLFSLPWFLWKDFFAAF